MHIYVATSNAGKLRDFRYAAEQIGESPAPNAQAVTLEPLPDLQNIPAPVEDQLTFEGNARLKAVFYARHLPGQWVLADDSGVEVDALEGRPGVRSAYFAEDLGGLNPAAGVDASNNAALLLAMLEQTNRSARYRCALALARDGDVRHLSFGTLEGEILSDPEGIDGFGYDPLFFVPELGRSMAQATTAERLEFSHRGRALRSLLTVLSHDPLFVRP